MKVLHVIPSLDNSSGPTHVVVNLTEHLARLGCSVSVYYLAYEGVEAVKPSPELVEARGFPVTFSRRWGYSRSLGKALRGTIDECDIVHIHSVWMYPTVAAARACRKRDVPYIVAPHGSFEPWCLRQNAFAKKVYYLLVERGNLRSAEAVHAISALERRNLRRCAALRNVVVVAIGVDARWLGECESVHFRQRWGLSGQERLVLFLSRLHPKKGLDLLIPGFVRVKSRIPEAKLLIVGPAARGYGEQVHQMLRQHGIEENTIVTGELRGKEKWAAYRAADVFVLPSRSENFGIVVAEAMACGLPVVVSRETPWQDVETYKAGRWVKLEPVGMAESIVEILENPTLARQMGENGRALVREKYTWDNIAKRMLRLYENIIAGREPGSRLGDTVRCGV